MLRPGSIEVGLLDAVAQGVTVDVGELLVEALEFLQPLALGDQRLRADDQHGLQLTTGLKLLQDEACLDRLSYADLVCDQQSRTIRLDQFQDRSELVWDEIDS